MKYFGKNIFILFKLITKADIFMQFIILMLYCNLCNLHIIIFIDMFF